MEEIIQPNHTDDLDCWVETLAGRPHPGGQSVAEALYIRQILLSRQCTIEPSDSDWQSLQDRILSHGLPAARIHRLLPQTGLPAQTRCASGEDNRDRRKSSSGNQAGAMKNEERRDPDNFENQVG